jgi:hypothetical protein
MKKLLFSGEEGGFEVFEDRKLMIIAYKQDLNPCTSSQTSETHPGMTVEGA